MNIDKNMLSSLAALDDASLLAAIRTVASANGIDVSSLPLDAASLRDLRGAMQNATPADLAKLQSVIAGLEK